MTAKKIAPEFTRTRKFLLSYSVLDEAEADIATIFAMGTWCFGPACQWPATYPYLYVTGPAGSGKTVLGQDSLGCVCREHTSATGATGSTLFRMLGFENEETGEIENLAPTLFLDEIDTTYSGAKDADLQRALDVGYKRGATIPRSAGRTFVAFPVFGPKLLLGIDNGHLPEPLLQRCIRLEMKKQTQAQLDEAGIKPFYIFDVEEEAAEMQEELAEWAKQNSSVLREYRPTPPKGLSARQWEISRSLVQLAHAAGVEDRIVKSLVDVLTRNPERPSQKVTLYQAIWDAFSAMPGEHADRITTKQILAALNERGIAVPGNSGKGLASVLSADGIAPDYIRLRDGHPGRAIARSEDTPTHRGYYRHKFDGAFLRYLDDDEDE